jgi:RNase P subunit RPR2
MIEVLRKGEKPEDRTYSAACGNCKSLLRFKRSEAEYVSDQRDGDAVTIECPVCKSKVFVAADSYRKQPSASGIDALVKRQGGSW